MGAREWQPGDVVKARVQPRGGDEQVVVYTGEDTYDWLICSGLGGRVTSQIVQNPRPLVVIDPEDREQVDRFREIASRWADQVPYADMREDGDTDHIDAMQAALREFAAPTPPKPDEPLGLGAVVRDDDNAVWLRARNTSHIAWRRAVGGGWREWRDLNVSSPDQILSAGWSEGGESE